MLSSAPRPPQGGLPEEIVTFEIQINTECFFSVFQILHGAYLHSHTQNHLWSEFQMQLGIFYWSIPIPSSTSQSNMNFLLVPPHLLSVSTLVPTCSRAGQHQALGLFCSKAQVFHGNPHWVPSRKHCQLLQTHQLSKACYIPGPV